eukprot:1259592-Rhodomonas_salina.2
MRSVGPGSEPAAHARVQAARARARTPHLALFPQHLLLLPGSRGSSVPLGLDLLGTPALSVATAPSRSHTLRKLGCKFLCRGRALSIEPEENQVRRLRSAPHVIAQTGQSEEATALDLEGEYARLVPEARRSGQRVGAWHGVQRQH